MWRWSRKVRPFPQQSQYNLSSSINSIQQPTKQPKQNHGPPSISTTDNKRATTSTSRAQTIRTPIAPIFLPKILLPRWPPRQQRQWQSTTNTTQRCQQSGEDSILLNSRRLDAMDRSRPAGQLLHLRARGQRGVQCVFVFRVDASKFKDNSTTSKISGNLLTHRTTDRKHNLPRPRRQLPPR